MASEMVYNLADHSILERNLSQNLDHDNCCSGSIQILLQVAGTFFIRMIEQNERLIWIKFVIFVMFQVVVFYADLVKDVYFLFIYKKFVGTSDNFRSLKYQVLILLIFSITISIALNFILIAKKICKLVQDRKRRLLILVFALFTSPFSPAFVLYLRCRIATLQELQNIKFWARRQTSDRPDSIADFNGPISRLDKLFAELRQNENSFELFTQAVLLIMVILLKFTNTATQKFPQALFTSGSGVLIVISALWSFVSMVVGYLHCTNLTKGNILPMKGKIILSVFAILSLIARLSSVILYFAPGLGLMDLLGHYEMGQLPTSSDALVYDTKDKHVTFSEAWEDFMFNSTNADSDGYTVLTIYTLETTYIWFLFLIFVHYVCVIVVKYLTALKFKDRKDLTDKIFHVLTQLIYPTTYKDWDECGDDEVTSNWNQNCLEMKLMSALFALEHLILCGPIFILTSKILERNSVMDGYFPLVLEEQDSTTMALKLSIAFPIFYILLPVIQYMLFVAFHKYGHPWSSILNTSVRDNCQSH